MKFSEYFQSTRKRPDRVRIKKPMWAGLPTRTQARPKVSLSVETCGRFRGTVGRPPHNPSVILLPDGETVHNAFFDRNFEP